MFDPVDPRQSFPDLERGILKYWQEEDTFKRSIRARAGVSGDPLLGTRPEGGETFSFFDGPPFATGLPHYGHLLAGTIKDVIPRYQTMRGKKVERRFGWDCHGLPVEYEIEKEHGIQSRQEIEKMGVAAFNKLCRSAVQRYAKEWRVTVERMGRWVDMDWDYRTMDPDYMESIWWVFQSLYDKKLIYEGHKPMHICPRCVTPLSNFEVTQGYKEITDLSVYAKFELESDQRLAISDQKMYLLAWTTTPWTLPGNLFLAVHPEVMYKTFTHLKTGDTFIASERFVEKILTEDAAKKEPEFSASEEKSLKGKELLNKKFVPLFPYYADKYQDKAFKVVDGKEFVTIEDGTGIVHIATGFGEDDYIVGKKEGIDPPLQHVTMDGKFTNDVTDFAGQEVKPKDDSSKMDKKIAEWLEKNGKLFAKESFKHTYPHCWRCDSPLLNYATSSWFVAVEKIKETMLQVNAETEWVPSHIRDGRFGKWLEGARDWAISRNRYWGTPLPIWRSADGKDLEVIGSREELMEKNLIRFTRVTALRHAESEGNVSPRYQGKEPGTDLTENGRAQAAMTAAGLTTEKVTRIYCSPLQRTRQTAEIIAKETGAEVIVDDRLREIAFGDYEGKSVDFGDLTFVKARRAHKFETGQIESIYHFPGMETWSQVQARIGGFLQEILPKHRGEHIVIVSHADPVQNMRHFFTGEDPIKLSHQPYPFFATPYSFCWDHDAGASLDLHKETVDEIVWPGAKTNASVDVTLVRHGSTDWNDAGKALGAESDIPLNEKGREQVKTLAKNLKEQTFDAIVCSDLKRTVETAQILSQELGIPHIEQWQELRERKFGEWCGRSLKEILKDAPGIVEGQTLAFHHLTPPGGESLSQLLQRVQKAYVRLLNTYPGKRILVVTHQGTIQALSVLVNNLSFAGGIASGIKNATSASLTLHPPLRRIPDVLDCWFESGSMPYAQSHFPFAGRNSSDPDKRSAVSDQRSVSDAKRLSLNAKRSPAQAGLPPGFPADFIAEGIDQTRGWFYTLTVLSSALFTLPAFRHCIVNGTVLAEDGKKMSKRLKNYPEPLQIVEQHGADAVRFALMSSPAVRGEDMRFSGKLVEETLRGVLLPLWNTYSFFVTYANAAKWEPTGSRKRSAHPLDQWIRAEVQDLCNRMTHELDSYDLSATCSELSDSIDALTNWYVRLSRRRFAGKSGLRETSATDDYTEERNDALSTLHSVLITLSQLLAPFCPFVTEAMYLNLVPEEHGSVHLTDWPLSRELTEAEQALLTKNRVLRTVVSLGLKIRAEKKLKLRQPLAKATIALPPSVRAATALATADLRLLQEELNVKAIELTDDPGLLADTFVQVDARKVGPRLGGRVQDIIKAGKSGDFALQADGRILILDESLAPDEAAIVYRGKEGKDVAADKGIVVALDTVLTEELTLEGKARDLIRAVQQLRKDAGLEMGDTITLSITGADDLLQTFSDLIAQETNAALGQSTGEAHEIAIDDQAITIRFHS